MKHLCLLIIWILYFIYSVFFPKTCKFKVFKLLKKFQRKICYSDLTFIYKAGKYREIQGSSGEQGGSKWSTREYRGVKGSTGEQGGSKGSTREYREYE